MNRAVLFAIVFGDDRKRVGSGNKLRPSTQACARSYSLPIRLITQSTSRRRSMSFRPTGPGIALADSRLPRHDSAARSSVTTARATATSSLHKPSMAHHQGLPGERVAREGGEQQRHLGDVFDGRELTVHGLLEHHVLDHLLLADT